MKTRIPKITAWSGSNADASAFFQGCLGGNIPVAAPVAAPAEPAKAPVALVKAASKPKPVVKPCGKMQRGMAWEYTHYKKKDGDIIISADEAQKEMSFNFYNCENIKVVIPNKIKSILLSRCKKVDL